MFAKRGIFLYPVFFLGVFFISCGKSPTSLAKQQSHLTAVNTSLLTQVPYDQVWETLLATLIKELIPLEIKDKHKGIFSSEVMTNTGSLPLQKVRFSGTVHRTPEGQKITVYRFIQQLTPEKEWQTLISDQTYEREFINKLKAALSAP